MRSTFEPQTRVPGATRRLDPETFIPISDKKGRPLWNMPAPVRYAEHTRRFKEKDEETGKPTGRVITEKIRVPVYRGASAEYVRWVRGQIKRNQRKIAEAQAAAEAKEIAMQEAEAALEDLVLNPGGHNVEGPT